MIQVFALILFLMGLEPVQAAAPLKVNVTVGKVSEVVLPEKVAKIVKGGNTESVLVEVIDNSVYIMPKSNTPPDIFVAGISGETYPLELVIAAQRDMRVQVGGTSAVRHSQNVQVDVMDLMKDILSGREPAGATVINDVEKAVTLGDQQIQYTIQTVYDYPTMAAYILKAQNQERNSVMLPLQQITFPNLLAITADRDLLGPKGKEGDATNIYLITGK